MEQIGRAISSLACLFIRGYRYFISPCLTPRCRFIPTCSQYALQAIEQFGIKKGCWLTTRRLLRCHPWAQCGYDPVLPKIEND